ncbi:hypothetical protein EVAR_28437_1 [Eumeta japonica]|uniref:Uncharacterized protein n=1 Tax=Eumeta variegata TaxID=151549 RepID=A0A4C1V995_EUMVA|nr:hypothetical protein EVAR_28437_1 [Eumeta japonica]
MRISEKRVTPAQSVNVPRAPNTGRVRRDTGRLVRREPIVHTLSPSDVGYIVMLAVIINFVQLGRPVELELKTEQGVESRTRPESKSRTKPRPKTKRD